LQCFDPLKPCSGKTSQHLCRLAFSSSSLRAYGDPYPLSCPLLSTHFFDSPLFPIPCPPSPMALCRFQPLTGPRIMPAHGGTCSMSPKCRVFLSGMRFVPQNLSAWSREREKRGSEKTRQRKKTRGEEKGEGARRQARVPEGPLVLFTASPPDLCPQTSLWPPKPPQSRSGFGRDHLVD
jgi:hypothetical protein